MPLKFRFALLTAALMLVLSVNALANSGEGAPEAPAPAQEETAEKASPFAPLRTYAGEFADVKSGDWFAPRSSPPMNTVSSPGVGTVRSRRATM